MDLPAPNQASLNSESRARKQARDEIAQRLALISLVIWSVGVLLFITAFLPGRPFKPSIGMQFALVMAGVAALPWLAWRPLVERRLRRG